MTPEKPESDERFTRQWDVYLDLEEAGEELLEPEPEEDEGSKIFPLLTASCADLVAILLPCTLALVGLRLAGLPVTLAVAPWALVLGAVWWLLAAGILLRVRRGTPGMLAAGLVHQDEPAGARLWGGLVLALLAATTVGLPLIPFRRAVWARLEAVDAEAE